MEESRISQGFELASGLRLADGRMLGCGMSEQLNSREGECADAEHMARLAELAAPRSAFDQALLIYLDLLPRSGATGKRDGRRKAILAALNHEATWDQVRSWRRDRRAVPQWARELLASKLAKRAESLTRGLSALK